MLLLFYFLCLKFSIAPQCAFIFMYVSIYFHQNTTLPPKFPCKSSTLCHLEECVGVRFFHIKLLPSQPATTNATCFFFFMLYILIWWRHDLSSLALYSWNHKRQQQRRQHKYATDNEKQLFCQRLIENYWEFYFFHTNVAWRNFLSLFKYFLSSWKGRIGWFFYGIIRWSVFFFIP